MHDSFQEKKKLLFQYEVLRARLDIREFFLKTIVRDIYEDVGQVLSLVRMQLAIVNPGTIEHKIKNMKESGSLVGKSIKDLRGMCDRFFPDTTLVEERGFIESLCTAIKLLGLHSSPVINTEGASDEKTTTLKLYVFKMLLDVLISIKKISAKLNYILITYSNDSINYIIDYMGESIRLESETQQEDTIKYLSLNERIQLIEASFQSEQMNNGQTRITLKIPLEISL